MIQSFKMAIKSISGNKTRAFLTMLGIIIGVVALVVLVSLVNGATSSVTDTINSLGNNLLTISVSDDKGYPVKLSDLEEWTKEEGIGLVSPNESTSATAKYDATNGSITVYGCTYASFEVEGLSLLMGRFVKTTDVDNNSYVCVINETTATELIGYVDCIGKELSINGIKFTVIGVLEDNENSLTASFGSGSLVVYIPYTTLLRLSDSASTNITSFYVSAEEGSDIATAEAVMTPLLYERFEEDEDAYEVSSQDVLEDTMSNVTSIFTVLLGGIAGISLLVGGIGIMNIMLVTVTERTREIGIRKAIGASRGEILRQFLLEAVVLCMMGCAIGIFLSWLILRLASNVVSSLSMSFNLDAGVVLIAVCFCFLIGVVFGLYPANKAAKMKPIDALHYGG